MNTSQPAAGHWKAVDKPAGDGIAANRKNDGCFSSCRFSGRNDRSCQRIDQANVFLFQRLRALLRGGGLPLGVFDEKDKLFAFFQAKFFQALAQSVEGLVLGATGEEYPDAIRFRWLRRYGLAKSNTGEDENKKYLRKK